MTSYDANDILQSPAYREELAAQRTFMARVYGWMTIGLLLTALIALAVATVPAARAMLLNPPMMIAMIVVQLAIAFGFRAIQRSFPAVVSIAAFLLYAGVTGVTFSTIFLQYKLPMVGAAFFTTAGTFGAMCVWGWVTKKDLTSLGSFLFMGLIGLIIAGIVSIFLPNPMFHFLICVVGVIVFTLFTAYDTQRFKQAYAEGGIGTDANSKVAINGAFELYLDFVCLFIYILQLFARRD